MELRDGARVPFVPEGAGGANAPTEGAARPSQSPQLLPLAIDGPPDPDSAGVGPVEDGVERDGVRDDPAREARPRSTSAPVRTRFARFGTGVTSAVLNVVLIGLIAFAALAGIRSITGRSDTQQAIAASAAIPTPVVTREAKRETAYKVDRRYTGLIEAARSARLGFEVAGRVEDAPVSIGDRLAKGDVVGRLSTRRTDAQIGELRAKIEQAEATLALRRSEARRADELLGRGVGTRADADEARAGLVAAEGEVASLRSRIDVLEADREDATLRAPFAGLVTSVEFVTGDVVAAGTPVVHLVDQGSLEARVGVPLDVARDLAVGDPVRLQLREREAEATLEGLVPRVDTGSRTVLAIASLPEGLAGLEGETVILRTEQRVEQNGFWVPLAALVADVRGLFAVQIVEQDGADRQHVVRAPVQVLYTDGVRAFVSGALRDGDAIVVEGTNRVSPGQAVASVREKGGSTARSAKRPLTLAGPAEAAR